MQPRLARMPSSSPTSACLIYAKQKHPNLRQCPVSPKASGRRRVHTRRAGADGSWNCEYFPCATDPWAAPLSLGCREAPRLLLQDRRRSACRLRLSRRGHLLEAGALFRGVFLQVADRLRSAGKQVVISTNALVTSAREMADIRKHASEDAAVEANDVARLQSLHASRM